MSKKYLRAADVAEMLDLSLQRVYALTRENIIPAVYCGRIIRYDPEAIEQFCRSGGKKYDA